MRFSLFHLQSSSSITYYYSYSHEKEGSNLWYQVITQTPLGLPLAVYSIELLLYEGNFLLYFYQLKDWTTEISQNLTSARGNSDLKSDKPFPCMQGAKPWLQWKAKLFWCKGEKNINKITPQICLKYPLLQSFIYLNHSKSLLRRSNPTITQLVTILLLLAPTNMKLWKNLLEGNPPSSQAECGWQFVSPGNWSGPSQ